MLKLHFVSLITLESQGSTLKIYLRSLQIHQQQYLTHNHKKKDKNQFWQKMYQQLIQQLQHRQISLGSKINQKIQNVNAISLHRKNQNEYEFLEQVGQVEFHESRYEKC